jgi:hypothetical protein
MISWIIILTIFFYNTIKTAVRNLFPALGISEDIMLAIIGWFLSKKGGALGELGLGLIYGAVASLGTSGGIPLAGLFGGGARTTAQAQPVYAEAVEY